MALVWAWALIVFFSSIPLKFLDLSPLVRSGEQAVGVKLLGPVIAEFSSVASVRYLAYGAALIVGVLCLHWLDARRPRIFAWLWAYSAVALVSVIWSVSPVLGAVKGIALLAAVVVLIALQAKPDGSELVVATTRRVATAVVLAAIAIAAFFPDYGWDPYYRWYPRLGGEFVYANDLAQYAGILFLLARYWPAGGRCYSRVVACGLSLAVLLATQSRTSIGALAASVALIEGVRTNTAVRALAVTLVALAVLGVVVLDVDLWQYMGVFGRGGSGELTHTWAERMDLWVYGLEEGSKSLLLGHGFAVGSRVLMGDAFAWRPFHAHSAFLETFMELGLLGVALLAGLVIAAMASLLRMARTAAAESLRGLTGIGLLTFLLFSGLTDRGFGGELSISLVGLLVVVAIAASRSSNRTPDPDPPR